MQKIPFHIISGFLGSGKTTLLKRIIDKYSDKTKIGVIQNEFAPANIDGVELKETGNNFNLLEINNGSVFCVCLLGNFVRSLEKFVDENQPDVVIIETSGLSDTTSITEVLSSGTLARKIFLASNWCIVDAQNFSKTGLMKQRVVHQLRMADVVVLNKIDLIENDPDDVTKEIKQINPFADFKATSFCNIDFELGNSAVDKFYLDNVKPMERPDVRAMVIKSGRKISEHSLLDFLKDWSKKAFRIKGFVNLNDGNSVAVQCTFGSVETERIESFAQPTEIIALTTEFSLREWSRAFKELK